METQARIPAAPAGYATINPFIVTDDADGLIGFLEQVFGATERPEARTLDHDGLLLHAELTLGNVTVMLGERKPDWPFTPSLLQVYVDDLTRTLDVARRLGATIVTEPTEFFGDALSRLRDPWGNLWWVYAHDESASTPDGDWSATDTDAEAWQATSPTLSYVHDTLVRAMTGLTDPRSRGE